MKKFLHRRPSASMLVAMTALVVAMSGTAVAASMVNGNSLIKKHSLSGNRLHNHTITGAQVNLNKLGKVPSAKNADHATTAGSATTATTATAAVTAAAATNATNAANAAELGGALPSAYEPSSHFFRTGLVSLASGGSVTLATFAPFTVTFKCIAGTSGAVGDELDATSTVANSVAYGDMMPTAGTAVPFLTDGATTSFRDDDANTVDFLAPTGQNYQALVSVGENFPGSAGKCFADAVIITS